LASPFLALTFFGAVGSHASKASDESKVTSAGAATGAAGEGVATTGGGCGRLDDASAFVKCPTVGEEKTGDMAGAPKSKTWSCAAVGAGAVAHGDDGASSYDGKADERDRRLAVGDCIRKDGDLREAERLWARRAAGIAGEACVG
jgi:hypothetical protein